MRNPRRFVNKRFHCCWSQCARHCVLCAGRMSQRRTRQHSWPESEQLGSQISTRSRVSNGFHTPPCPAGKDRPAGPPALAHADAHAGSAVQLDIVTAESEEAAELQGKPLMHVTGAITADQGLATISVSNGQDRPGQTPSCQTNASDSDSDSDCVLVSTGARCTATTVSAAHLLPAHALPVFTVSREARFRNGERLRMRPRFSFPRVLPVLNVLWVDRTLDSNLNCQRRKQMPAANIAV